MQAKSPAPLQTLLASSSVGRKRERGEAGRGYAADSTSTTNKWVWECADLLAPFSPPLQPPPLDMHKQKKEGKEKEAEGKVREALLIANAPLPSRHLLDLLWSKAGLHICADGGANRLFDLHHQYKPDYVVGDMDSVRPSVLYHFQQAGSQVKSSADQDTTDLHKCLTFIAETEQQQRKKYDVINVLGGLGGNFSHELANVNILYLFKHRKLFLFSDQNIAFLLHPGHHIIRARNPGNEIRRIFCGLIPMGGRCNSITTKGLRWNLQKGALEFGGMVSTSNEVAEDHTEVELTISDPVLWTFDARPEEGKVHG